MVRILVVDDSITAHQALSQMMNGTSDMQIVAQARSGTEAIYQVQKVKPDIILMDLFMPSMDGLEATEEIMALQPTPIIIMSGSLSDQEAQATFQAMRLGALAVIAKPVGPLHPDYEREKTTFLTKIRILANVKVIHHRKALQAKPNAIPPQVKIVDLPTIQPRLIAMAISTGGPGTMADILRLFPADFPIPIVVVQHITDEFVPSLVKWLNSLTPLQVQIAETGGIPQAGHVYYAPGNAHLLLNSARRFALDKTTPATHMPSADILFESVATHYKNTAIGIILTGMGDDGVKGLRKMYDNGAYTIAQDEASSVVYGMPREAIASGAVKRVASALEIPEILKKIVKQG